MTLVWRALASIGLGIVLSQPALADRNTPVTAPTTACCVCAGTTCTPLLACVSGSLTATACAAACAARGADCIATRYIRNRSCASGCGGRTK